MTLDDWLNRVSGYTVRVPAGTDTREYMSEPTLPADAHVTITLDPAIMRRLVGRALKNRSRRSHVGPLTVKAWLKGDKA